MSVSVILPVHDNRETLPLAVESILNQTFSDFELLIICNGSPAPVRDFVESLNDPRVRSFFLPAPALARALNYGIKLSSGKYIARMDADDFCSPARLQKQFDYLETHPETGVVTSLVSHQGEGKGFERFIRWQNSLRSHNDMFSARFRDAVVCHPSVMFRRSLFFKYGGYSENPGIPEDFELWLRWFENRVNFHKIPEPLFTWRDHTSRLSRNHPAYADHQFFLVKIQYLKRHLLRNGIKDRPVLILGNSRLINQKIRDLKLNGVEIYRKVDFKTKSGNSGIITYDQMKSIENPFLISLVRDYSGREKIKQFLDNEGFIEGSDYLMLE